MEKKVVLITGASSGLGKATATYLATKGYNIYGTSRNASFPPHAKKEHMVTMIKMDVNDNKSIEQAIDHILKQEKRIDVVINNAGWGIASSIEETTIEQTKALFETNYFGTQRICQAVLPIMRTQSSGCIINISSIGGVLGLPFQGLYSASKFAVEGMTESLRMEVKSFGINVVLIEPGDFHTSFTSNREKIIKTKSDSAYTSLIKKTTTVFEHDEEHGSSPEIIARLIEKIIQTKNPKLRYRAGSFTQKLAAKIKGVLPDRFVQWILMKYYQID